MTLLALDVQAADGQALVVPQPAGSPAWQRYVNEGRDSPFGLDYIFVLDRQFRQPELARQLGGLVGVRWVNFARVNWGEIRPRRGGRPTRVPLVGTGRGRAAWQQYGVHIMISLVSVPNLISAGFFREN